MALSLHNTRTRKKELFEPLDAARVGMYVCGPTVYDLAHIGNARPIVVFDLLYRLLRDIYGADHVTYVRNITDVDDKINAAALETGPALLVVNKFGKQELDGRGFRPLIGEALSRGIAVLTAVNPGNLPGFLEFAGDYAEALPPDVDAIVDWCNAQRLAA